MKTTPTHGPTWALAASAALLLACSAVSGAVATATPPPAAPPSPVQPSSTVRAPSAVASPTNEVTSTATETPIASPTAMSMATVSATAASVLKGSVNQRSNCRYGPGAFFLSKIGMLAGAPIEVLGRDIDGGWAYIQFAGTHNLCWINSTLITVDGDLMRLTDYYPDKAPLPRTSKFPGAAVLSANASATSITVEWSPVVLPAAAMPSGASETEYVIEVWTCRNGAPGYTTYGTNDTTLDIQVDNSCGMTVRANLVTQTNLGISGVASIPLP